MKPVAPDICQNRDVLIGTLPNDSNKCMSCDCFQPVKKHANCLYLVFVDSQGPSQTHSSKDVFQNTHWDFSKILQLELQKHLEPAHFES